MVNYQIFVMMSLWYHPPSIEIENGSNLERDISDIFNYFYLHVYMESVVH